HQHRHRRPPLHHREGRQQAHQQHLHQARPAAVGGRQQAGAGGAGLPQQLTRYLRTTRFWLSTNLPTSEASISITDATWLGCMIVVGSSSGARVRRRSVAQRPGEMTTTRVPYIDDSSSRMTSLMLITAALDAE